MSTGRMGFGGLGRIWETVNVVMKKKYPLQNIALFYMLAMGGYLFVIFGNPRTDAWYIEFGVLGASLVVAFLLFLLAGLYEPKIDNLTDAVKEAKQTRLPPENQPIIVQMKHELSTLSEDTRATKKDITEIQTNLKKVITQLEIKKDETLLITKRELIDQTNKDITKATSRIRFPEKEKLLQELEDLES